MSNFIPDDIRALCRQDFDVRIDPRVELDFRHPLAIAVEAPVQIRPCTIDVDLLGAFSYLGGGNSFLRHVGVIGRFTAIAANAQIGLPEHPLDFVAIHPLFYGDFQSEASDAFRERNRPMTDKAKAIFDQRREERFGKVNIGNDVWIGEGVLIRRGVEIGDGAIIGARSVVTRDVPPYAIVAGAPAKVIRYRFEPEVVAELLRLQWWLYGLSALEGADFTDIDMALWRIDDNIASGRAEPYCAPVLEVGVDSLIVHRFEPEAGSVAA